MEIEISKGIQSGGEVERMDNLSCLSLVLSRNILISTGLGG
jgi:hypothetical protein